MQERPSLPRMARPLATKASVPPQHHRDGIKQQSRLPARSPAPPEPTSPAHLRRRAAPALDHSPAAIAGRPAIDVLLRAAEGETARPGREAALPADSPAATRRRRRADAAHQLAAAAVTGRAAVDALLGAGERLAARVGGPAASGDTSTSAGLRRRASPALQNASASIGGGTALDAQLDAGPRLALAAAIHARRLATPRPAAQVEPASAAALRRDTRPALEQAAATVRGIPAVVAGHPERRTGRWHAYLRVRLGGVHG
jgi:hypothetical protein